MDGDRFDHLARRFASGTSRRSLVRSAVVAIGAAMVPATGAGAAQVPRPLGAICRKDGDCIAGASCAAIATGRSVCTCTSELKPCRGACIPNASCCTATDCADDGNACTTAVCNPNGACVHVTRTDGSSCGQGLTCCGGDCVDLTTSMEHCFACGNACPESLSGATVSCGTVTNDADPDFGASGCLFQCIGVFADCDDNPINGCETDLGKEPNCGNCGVTCADGECCSGCSCQPQSFCDNNIGQTCEGILRSARLFRRP